MNDFFYDSAARVLSFVCLGVVLGAIYDFFRVLRISRKGGGNLSGGIYDRLKPKKDIKWLASEAIYIYYINDGEIRVDFFVLSLAGFMLYRISLGKVVIFLADRIIFFARCLLLRLIYIIIYPVRMMWKFVSAAIAKAACVMAGAVFDAKRRAYTRRGKKRLLDLSARGFEEK